MQITLPPEAQAIIDRNVASGRFQSVEQAIVEAIYLLDDEPMAYDPMADPELLESVVQADRGETYEVNDDLRARIREEVAAAMARGDKVPDDVTY